MPLISRQRMVIAGVLVLGAIALLVAVRVVSVGAFATDAESPLQMIEPDYLAEIGFGVEYGFSAQVLHKWTQDVRIKVRGAPTDVDLQILELVVSELTRQ